MKASTALRLLKARSGGRTDVYCVGNHDRRDAVWLKGCSPQEGVEVCAICLDHLAEQYDEPSALAIAFLQGHDRYGIEPCQCCLSILEKELGAQDQEPPSDSIAEVPFGVEGDEPCQMNKT